MLGRGQAQVSRRCFSSRATVTRPTIRRAPLAPAVACARLTQRLDAGTRHASADARWSTSTQRTGFPRERPPRHEGANTTSARSTYPTRAIPQGVPTDARSASLEVVYRGPRRHSDVTDGDRDPSTARAPEATRPIPGPLIWGVHLRRSGRSEECSRKSEPVTREEVETGACPSGCPYYPVPIIHYP